MKTKLVLLAMALPAFFAACTSDEFVEPTQGDLNGRALLGGLTVNVDQNDVNTRFAWANNSWKFEAGDQFGAALTDPTLGEVQDDQLLGNYIFSQSASGSYSTTSQMYEGIYSFYSYPNFESKATRDLIKFDLGTQTADLTKPEELINKTQLFFSPLYDIKAKTVGTALPLKFYPYWSVAAFKIKNTTGKAFKISQIVLKDGTKKFLAQGEISAEKIEAAKLIYKIAEGESEYTLPKDVKYDEAMATGDFAKDGGPAAVSSIALNCGNYELANGQEITAYMNVPAGAQTNMEVEIIVNVDGDSKAIKVTEVAAQGDPTTTTSIASVGINTLQFKRGQTKAVFGLTTGDKEMKSLNVEAKHLQNASGFYVDNKVDLLNVINNNRGDIKFFNMGDIAIDKEIAAALVGNSAASVTFANPIEIKVTGDAKIAKTTFTGMVTVNSGNVTFDDATILSEGMSVKGGKAILKKGTYTAADITVDGGELAVSALLVIKSVTVNSGALTINGTVAQNIDDDGIKALSFGSEKATTLNVDLTGDTDLLKTLKIDVAVALDKKTTMNIAPGNIVAIASGKTLTNAGKIVNSGTINGAGTLTNTGTIETAGTIGATAVSNAGGFIKLTNEWDSNVKTTEGAGLIDNTIGGLVANTGSTVYRVFTGDVSMVNVEATDLIVFNNVTLKEAVDVSANANQKVLLLGTTNLYADLTMAATATLQIGLENESDSYAPLAGTVLGKDFSVAENVTDYKKTIATYVYEGVTIGTPILKNYGTVSKNKGTINYKSAGSTAGTWLPEGTIAGS